MASVAYSSSAGRDLERLVDFLLDQNPDGALETVDLVTNAIAMLGDHPLLGREVSGHRRELVISRGRSGYLALYDDVPATDSILILAIRHQREAGYLDPSSPA